MIRPRSSVAEHPLPASGLADRLPQARPPVLILSCVLVTLGLLGCGGEGPVSARDRTEPLSPSPPEHSNSPGRPPALPSRSTSRARGDVPRPRSKVLPDGRRVIENGLGGSVTLPAPPKAIETTPSAKCTRRGGGPPGPPTPGIRAAGLSRSSVLVTYRFRRLPSDCAPHSILLTLGRGDGAEASVNQFHRIRPERRIVARVPHYWRNPPDLVHATALTRDELGSESTSVRISP